MDSKEKYYSRQKSFIGNYNLRRASFKKLLFDQLTSLMSLLKGVNPPVVKNKIGAEHSINQIRISLFIFF